jgi:hypothetical protein
MKAYTITYLDGHKEVVETPDNHHAGYSSQYANQVRLYDNSGKLIKKFCDVKRYRMDQVDEQKRTTSTVATSNTR